MASLSKRSDSQYWRLAYRHPITRRRILQATPYRWRDRAETRAARELCARKALEEKQARTVDPRGRWTTWVRPYLDSRYNLKEPGSSLTNQRYIGAWKTIEAFLHDIGVVTPIGVNHSTVMAYLDWRRDAEKQGREIAPRTVLLEIKVLGIIIDEAIRRGFAIVNPCRRLGLSRVATREKPEITLEEEQLIRRQLATRPEWMRVSFDIAMAQGCRFKETRLRLSEVDLARRRILFRTKGRKVFETALNPVLIPVLRRLKRRGADYTWDLPPNDMGHTARNWTRFFRKIGLPHICFHCTRVTAITRAHRAGVSQAKAMRFFGHSSTAVHAIYTKLGTEDVSEVADALAACAPPQSDAVPRNQSHGNVDFSPATGAHAKASSVSRIEIDSRSPSLRSRKAVKRPSLRRAPLH